MGFLTRRRTRTRTTDVPDSRAAWPRGMRLPENSVPSWLRDPESGVTALEYALLGSLVALGLIAGATAFGKQLGEAYDNIATTAANALGL